VDSAAIEMRPTSSVRRNCPRPPPELAEHVVVGDEDVVEEQLARVEGAPADAAHLGALRVARVSRSTTKLANDGRPRSSSPVRASTVTPKLMSVPAFEMNAFCPLRSQPPSTFAARVLIAAASEPAPGSVRPNAPSARPSARGRATLLLRVGALREQRQAADRDVGLPGGGDRLVGVAERLHRRDESDRRDAGPAPLLGDEQPEEAEVPIGRRTSVGQRSSSQYRAGVRPDLLGREVARELLQRGLRRR
jgi:hypothetical protein